MRPRSSATVARRSQRLRQDQHPDVVLMDMNMPEMNGPEAIRRIRQDRRMDHIRVIGVSGLEQDEAGVETGESGVDQWYTKPVNARRLVNELGKQALTHTA